MCTAEVEDVTAVDVMVQSFLYQVLGFVTCQLCYPGEELRSYVKNIQSDSDIFAEGRKLKYFFEHLIHLACEKLSL